MTSQEIEILPKPTELEIRENEQILGVGVGYSIAHLLSCYETKLWTMEENEEWSKKAFDNFTTSKFILLRHLLMHQIEINGRFSITSPFENTCNKCAGSGEIYKFLRKTQTVKCMKCVKGKLPGGETCKTCQGNGEVKIFGIVAELRDTTICSFCKGKGFFKKQDVDNPALHTAAAEKLKKQIETNLVENQPTNLGAEVKSATVSDQVAPHITDPDQDEPIGEGSTQKVKQPPAD
jgi:hypothetical protein